MQRLRQNLDQIVHRVLVVCFSFCFVQQCHLGGLSLLHRYIESLAPLHGEPLDIFFHEQLEDIGLSAVELCRVNAHEMDDKVQVLPDFVVIVHMHLKTFFCLSIKCLSIYVADETNVLYVH